ncbi:MAG: PadR family transcriptional regulator [Candidatus Cloacimonas sp.]|nr:PadR family transcriptional regulator [Candidatus Cloacimonas sp.]
MSKAHMVVLSFLKAKPMYGYQIGQMVEQLGLPRWTGITLPAIYKAMQTLEKQQHIRGEEMREGNSPPRMVYHLNSKGKEYLRKTVQGYLTDIQLMDRDWWFALLFAQHNIGKDELLEAVNNRIKQMKEFQNNKPHGKACPKAIFGDNLPFVHNHLMSLGTRFVRAELLSLSELAKDIESGEHSEYFMIKGDASL